MMPRKPCIIQTLRSTLNLLATVCDKNRLIDALLHSSYAFLYLALLKFTIVLMCDMKSTLFCEGSLL